MLHALVTTTVKYLRKTPMDVTVIRSVALKWYFFTTASLVVYNEFSHLFMKQLGFNAQQIGVTTGFGIQHLLIPLFNLIGDKFRARGLVLWATSVPTFVICLLPLLPLIVSLPSCFGTSPLRSYENTLSLNGNGSLDSENQTEIYYDSNVPWSSNLFLLMLLSRPMTTLFEGVIDSTANVATLTHLGKDRAKFGSYYMWMPIGAAISISVSALFAWLLRINICGNEEYGYFMAFVVAALLVAMSLFSIPWFQFKYEKNRTIDAAGVKDFLRKGHYIYMYSMVLYIGFCASFQFYWEFWYLDGLDASPLVMAGAALVRRPIFAASNFFSTDVIKRLGDLRTLLVSLLLFVLSFLALSFTRLYWYVLAIDVVQATAFGLAYSALTVHFSKAGSKASSGFIMGIEAMCFEVGADAGAALMGVLFHKIGTRRTLLVFSLVTAIQFTIVLLYLRFSNRVTEYEKLAEESDVDDDFDNDQRFSGSGEE